MFIAREHKKTHKEDESYFASMFLKELALDPSLVQASYFLHF
jgi:hypothetical protein